MMNRPPARVPELAALLGAHGLAGAREEPMQHTGFSGATLVRLRRADGAAFVLKRMSIERDWIMRATDDAGCREAAFAQASIALPPSVQAPNSGVARNGDEYALLMRDIRDELVPQGMVGAETLGRVLTGIAALHGTIPPTDTTVPWCGLAKRLTLLTPGTARIAAQYGAPVADDVTRGWALFERHASPRAHDIIRSLFADASPLTRALGALPVSLLHGDLKFDNMGLSDDGQLWLFDWSMTLLAPAAVDLGWFLAINSRRMSIPRDDVMSRYAGTAARPNALRPRHDALTVLCGLLLRGWRKALDADDGEPSELRWWCERAEEAARWL